jgi:hypothetical protein
VKISQVGTGKMPMVWYGMTLPEGGQAGAAGFCAINAEKMK